MIGSTKVLNFKDLAGGEKMVYIRVDDQYYRLTLTHPPLGAYQVVFARFHQIGSVHKMGHKAERLLRVMETYA